MYSVIRYRYSEKVGAVTKIEKGMFRWFEHIARAHKTILAPQIDKVSASEQDDDGRQRLSYHDQTDDVQVKNIFNRRACIKALIHVDETKDGMSGSK